MLNSKFKRDLTKQFKKDFKLITVNEFHVGISCVRILNDDGKDGCNKDREDGSNLSFNSICILWLRLRWRCVLWVTGGRVGEGVIAFVVPSASAEAPDVVAAFVNALLISTVISMNRGGFIWAAGGNKIFFVRPLALTAGSPPVLRSAHPVLRKVFTALFALHSIVTVFALKAAGDAKKGSNEKESGKHF